MRPIAVKEMFNSWVWEPNLAAVLMHSGRHRHGITVRKSVITNCRHWNAVRINGSPWCSFTAPMISIMAGQPNERISPAVFRI